MNEKEKQKWIGRICGLIVLVLVGLLFLTNVSAIYGGECEQVELNFESYDNVTYFTIGNQSNLEGLNITLNGSTINICPVINYKPDNFTIVFMENKVNEVIKEVRVSSGGGHNTRYIYENVTEYVPIDNYVYLNNTDCPEVEVPNVDIPEKKNNIFQKFWDWIKRIFK